MTEMKSNLIDMVKNAVAEVTWKAVIEGSKGFVPGYDTYRGCLNRTFNRDVEVFRYRSEGKSEYGVGWTNMVFRTKTINDNDVFPDRSLDGDLQDLYILVEKTYNAQQSSKK